MDPETEEWLRPRQILFNCSVENLPPLPRIFKVNLLHVMSKTSIECEPRLWHLELPAIHYLTFVR